MEILEAIEKSFGVINLHVEGLLLKIKDQNLEIKELNTNISENARETEEVVQEWKDAVQEWKDTVENLENQLALRLDLEVSDLRGKMIVEKFAEILKQEDYKTVETMLDSYELL